MQEYEIRLSGSGGQGLQLAARVLAEALNIEALTVAQSQSYEPVSRGGISRSDLVVSKGTAQYPLVSALDYLIVLDEIAATDSNALLKDSAVVMIDSGMVETMPEVKGKKGKLHSLPLTKAAMKLGNKRVANIVALGALVELSGICSPDSCREAIRARVPKRFLELNLEAFNEGAELAAA